ncbi:MAG: 3-hydroxyacyl-CoA dehydrogenase [Alphaproteobacteria bacterium TMED93]|nr:3-hydroxyacyl-CoA dehydrogenase [Candidatus Pelagibacter sp.]RPH06976.1 MAG: 3-hydroxyacyl-CoA dehydrogenase [Alphaproteobacteria bacterium TMED93]
MDTQAIKYEIIENIGIITGVNPPVNALSYNVRKGLVEALKLFLKNDNIKGIILCGEGRTFFAGADISEFGKPMQSPNLNEVILEYENSNKPIVAALHGSPLGGGLELAMGCNYRVALSSTKLGLPEVKLGIIPGAGGTQRLPRLAGVEKALSMITSGIPIDAKNALESGIIEEVFEDKLIENALNFIKSKLTLDIHPVASKLTEKVSNVKNDIFINFSNKIEKKHRGRKSPLCAIEAIKATTNLSFTDGLEKERELFKVCHDSKESSSLIHMFFSERKALKIPDIPKDTQILPINSAAVIGCGTMGGGIAMNFANVGIPVTVIENSQDSLDKGMNIIEKNYSNTVSKGRMTQNEFKKRMSLISGSSKLESISNADVVVEAVFEEMNLKKEMFSKIDALAKENSILATNTSTLDIDQIAESTSRPQFVIGTHFFSPANVMKLLEIVRGKHTSKEVIASTMKLAKNIKKVPVLAGNCDGFIGNRMFHEYVRQAHALAEEGAKVADIDRVIYDFGWAMGPFAVNDLAGNDVGWRIRKRHKQEGKYDNLRYTSTVADQLFELGRYGQKTNRGFYIYDQQTREKKIDPEVDMMFEKVAKEKGISRRQIDDKEILSRLSWALLNTGCMILEEGYALRASDIDVTYAYGYGYPHWRGGPMKYAEDYGLEKVLEEIKNYRTKNPDMWPKCNYLEQLVKEKKNFN